MGRIGIYGGSFDPVHKGHLNLAKTAIESFFLDEIVFVPAKISPFKQEKKDVASARDRISMLQLALENEKHMSISDYELKSDCVSYTVYTMRYMKKLYENDDIVLLMGSDGLMSFQRWYCWHEIISMAELGCISRNIGDYEQLMQTAKMLSEYGVVNVSCKNVFQISSTELRGLLKKGEECSCYLPENVVQYIIKNRLYGV